MKTKNFIICSMKAAAALLLTVTIAAGLSACSTEDNSVINNVEPANVMGSWYAEYDHAGIAGEGEHAKAFAKVVLYGALKENGFGLWMCVLVDADGKAVDLEDTFLGASCNYTVSKDGKVDIQLTGSSGAVTLHPSWTMDYRNGQLVGKVRDNVSCKMSPATDKQTEQVKVWLRQLGLGYSDEPVGLDTPVNNVDLSTLTSNYEATDGDVLKGKMPVDEHGIPKYVIVIPDGANVTLDNVTIGGDEKAEYASTSPAIHCYGDATITLKGINNLSGNWGDYPCIYVPEGKTLTIVDSTNYDLYVTQPNQLFVKNGGKGAGIGGSKALPDCGNIVFNHSAVYAQGGDGAPGIGSYSKGSCGYIWFTEGCYIEGRGGLNAVAVGCGKQGYCKEIILKSTNENNWNYVYAWAGKGADAAYGHPGDGQCEYVYVAFSMYACCSKEPTEDMLISDFIKADYVSMNTQIDWNISELSMFDGYEWNDGYWFPPIRRSGNELVI